MRLPYTLSLLALLAVGCVPVDGLDAGPDGGGEAPAVDEYSAGMMKMGSELHFVLVAADPAPPDTGNNTWTVRVTDMSDAPLDDLTVKVAPFMPEHDHGTSPADYTGTPTGDAGEYSLGPFDLFMPGEWEMTLSAEDADRSDDVVFRFAVEG